MDRWLVFLKERLPVPVLLLLSFGAGLSCLHLDQKPFQPLFLLLGTLQPGLFLLTLRLMDEVKDFEKDKQVHPERPLPRGLLSVTEVTRAIYLGLGLMFVVALIHGLQGRSLACGLYAFSTIYLWLMYKEFFVGTQLEKSPFLYAVTHQVIMLPLAASIRAMNLSSFSWPEFLSPGLMYLGVFFTFEICRKLDPNAVPLLRTYRVHYGERTTGLMILFTTALTLTGTFLLYAGSTWSLTVLIAFALSVPLSYLLLLHKQYKAIEGLASLSLLVHIWWPYGRALIGV